MTNKDTSNKSKDDGLIYLTRNKSYSIREKFNQFKDNLISFQLSKHYQNSSLLYKVCYDRINRSDLFKIISNTSPTQLNISRNIISMNDNLSIFNRKVYNEKIINEYDLYVEYTYITKSFNYFLWNNYTLYAYVPGLTFLLYMRLISKTTNSKLFFFYSSIGLSIIYAVSSNYLDNKRRKLEDSYMNKELKEKYEEEIELYRKYYYDN